MTAFIGASLSEKYTSAQMTGSEAGKVPGVGDRYVTHDGKAYKFVQYESGSGSVAAVAGNVVYYYGTTGATSGTVVTSDLSDSVNVTAGVLQSAPADGEYCWIQTGGYAVLNTALTAGADGNALTAVGATDGTLDVSAAVTDHIAAIALDADQKIVMLMCP